MIDQAQSFGFAEPIRPLIKNHKITRKNAREHNKTELSNQKHADEVRRSKDVIINQSNPSIIPITVTQDGLLGAAANHSPGGGNVEKSPIISSMINKSSNTTLGAQMGG